MDDNFSFFIDLARLLDTLENLAEIYNNNHGGGGARPAGTRHRKITGPSDAHLLACVVSKHFF